MYYKSRYRITNGLISLSFDSTTGELLEFNLESVRENLIKNHSYSLPQPLAIQTGDGRLLRPGDADAVSRFPVLRAEINVYKDGSGADVCYKYLWDGTLPCAVEAVYTVSLPEGSKESLWHLSIKNYSTAVLKDVRFPCINGVYLGKTWEDDTLVYPYVSGIKVLDPVTTFCSGQKVLCWRWQDYKYKYTTGSIANKFDDGLYCIEHFYTGHISMKWLDYYGEEGGLYFG